MPNERRRRSNAVRLSGAEDRKRPLAEVTEDALALARTTDIVVTGIRVPGPFDGVELVRRLRANDGTKHKPIIVVTACAFEPDQQRACAAGCDAFLPKPCLP